MSTWIDEQDQDKIGKALASMRASDAGIAAITAVDGDERFALWLALVDRAMARLAGVGHRDINDWTWRDAYQAATSPRDAAAQALAEDDTFGEDFSEFL